MALCILFITVLLEAQTALGPALRRNSTKSRDAVGAWPWSLPQSAPVPQLLRVDFWKLTANCPTPMGPSHLKMPGRLEVPPYPSPERQPLTSDSMTWGQKRLLLLLPGAITELAIPQSSLWKAEVKLQLRPPLFHSLILPPSLPGSFT